MFHRARAMLSEVKLSRFLLTQISLAVGIALDDGELLALEPDATMMREAFATGKPPIFGPLAGFVAQIRVARGDVTAARSLLRDAVTAAGAAATSLGTFPLAVSAAQYCARSEADAVRALCARDAARAALPLLPRRLPMRSFASASAAAIRLRRTPPPPVSPPSAGRYTRRSRASSAGSSMSRARSGRASATSALPGSISGCPDASDYTADPLAALLTSRELEIARLVASGCTNREAANTLSVSVS